MSFYRLTGSQRTALPSKIAKKASVALPANSLVISTAGQVDVAVAGSTKLLGIMQSPVVSTDADYAATTPVTVEAIDPAATYLADTTGTLAAANVGLFYDLSTNAVVDMGASTVKAVQILAVVDSSHAIVKFNPAVL